MTLTSVALTAVVTPVVLLSTILVSSSTHSLDLLLINLLLISVLLIILLTILDLDSWGIVLKVGGFVGQNFARLRDDFKRYRRLWQWFKSSIQEVESKINTRYICSLLILTNAKPPSQNDIMLSTNPLMTWVSDLCYNTIVIIYLEITRPKIA